MSVVKCSPIFNHTNTHAYHQCPYVEFCWLPPSCGNLFNCCKYLYFLNAKLWCSGWKLFCVGSKCQTFLQTILFRIQEWRWQPSTSNGWFNFPWKHSCPWQMGPSFQENLSFLPQMGSNGLGKLGKFVFSLGKLVKPYFPKASRLKISNMCTLTFPKVENFIDAKFYKLKLNPFVKVPSFLRN